MIVKARDKQKHRVSVNGMDVTRVGVEADDEAGYVKCIEWEGYPNPPTKDRVLRSGLPLVTLTGKVEIQPA